MANSRGHNEVLVNAAREQRRRRNRRRWLGAGLGLVVLGLGLGSAVSAQAPDPRDPTAVPTFATPLGAPKDFSRTPAEDEVWNLYHDDKLLTARRKVEELLEQDADSIVGHYVFSQILRQAEGNLPRAMQEIGKARELYERKHQPNAVNLANTPWLLHRDILYAAQQVAGELERHEYRLQLLDYHDSLYDPRLHAEHAWPLMLLGRFDEAREYAERASESPDAFQRSLGRNALCAIEAEAGERAPRFEACLAAYEAAATQARKDDPFARPDEVTAVTVHAYNAALAALAALRPDEAERLAKAGATRLEFTPANPWRLLVRLYIDQGRMEDAVSALRDMQGWRRKMPPNLREQVRAETDIAFATLLLVSATTETGMRVVDRAISTPDRRGLTTSSKEQALGAHGLLRRAMRRTHAEAEAERASWSGTAESARITRDAIERRVEDWADGERVRAVLNDDERLIATFSMYVAGGVEPVPSWLLGDLVEILGPGVCAVVLDSVRARERQGESGDYELLEPYYDALEAEIALARGRESEALRLAEQAIDALPESESLLRARVAALAGEAAWELGQRDEAVEYWATAMQREAGVIRRRGLALPASLDNQASGPVASRVVELLGDSPRFELGREGFTITLSGSERALELCLREPAGGLLGCAMTPAEPSTEGEGGSEDLPIKGEDGQPLPADGEPEELDDDDYAALTVEAFHQRAFAMPVGLSNIDLGSLDGTATVSEEANRERMQSLLDKLESEAKD